MNLLIISHTAHYHDTDSQIVSWGVTSEEINQLADLFDEVVHIAFSFSETPPKSSVPYKRSNIRFVGVPPTGGNSIFEKLKILKAYPGYIRIMLSELKNADLVHVRCPSNISLLAILLLSVLIRPTKSWVKYAGDWKPKRSEPWSNTFQRFWLEKGLHRGIVSVNGKWPKQPKHVYSFTNPSLYQAELALLRPLAEEKQLTYPIQLIYVGYLWDARGAGRAFEIARNLHGMGIHIELHYLGDGPDRERYETLSKNIGFSQYCKFHGWLGRDELFSYYQKAHFVILPSVAEGWPKVLSEGMAHGAVPVASSVSSIPQILASIGAGTSLDPLDVDGFTQAIADYIHYPDKWKSASLAGIRGADLFTYEYYKQTVKNMLNDAWNIEIMEREKE